MARHVHARQLEDQVLQALQTELGAIEVFATAMSTGSTEQAREWAESLDEARAYLDVLSNVLVSLGGDPDAMTPGRRLAMHHYDSLVQAIEMAKHEGDPIAARTIAAECVALAERMARQCRDRLGLMLERSRKRTARRACDTASNDAVRPAGMGTSRAYASQLAA